MKNSKLKKWSKRLLLTFGMVFLTLFVWANWEESTITEKLPTINLVTFDLSSLKDENSFALIQEEFNSKKGVTACAVNSKSKLVTFTFYPDVTSKEELLDDLQSLGGKSVCMKIFPSKAGCPVQGTKDFFGKIKESLKFR
ncbi:MAG: hypothetical protein V4622_04170 [Bacteroidota bacterium]